MTRETPNSATRRASSSDAICSLRRRTLRRVGSPPVTSGPLPVTRESRLAGENVSCVGAP